MLKVKEEKGEWTQIIALKGEKGDKGEDGENYVCIAPEGTVCVWSPKDYPEYWQKAV